MRPVPSGVPHTERRAISKLLGLGQAKPVVDPTDQVIPLHRLGNGFMWRTVKDLDSANDYF